MKFKDDGDGWRDLRLGTKDDELQVSIPTKKAHCKDKHPFISCCESWHYASYTLTRKQLRAFANAILKELDR